MPPRLLTDRDLHDVALADIGRPDGLAIALVDGIPPRPPRRRHPGVLDHAITVGALKQPRAVVPGRTRPGRTFFTILEADLIQTAALLAGPTPPASAPLSRRRPLRRPV